MFSQDLAGLGGDVHYLRSRISGAKYWDVFRHFIFSISLEAGYINGFDKGTANASNPMDLVHRE